MVMCYDSGGCTFVGAQAQGSLTAGAVAFVQHHWNVF